ncbi:homoserine dehydrogenase [Fusobacterium naviforme]|nr:homoserine dehydrogenase [Fusobacterium naviforme]PSL09855.1 homoserine dehydrogenase [Fusobacterium naviforme]STO27818.1 Homoserine dehydrogenase [Fusobacterium naviforme]
MIKAAIMGCGTIGSGVYEAVERNQAVIQRELGEELRIAKILDLRNFPGEPFEKLVVHDFQELVSDPEIRIVVETMGGTKPAYEFVKACLLAGKQVVTSNKALVAAHGTELLQIAREKQINFFFEAAVGGGIPVIRNLGSGYAGQVITEITGILNGTTNYILTRMEREGADFAAVLSEAQELGYAERNPEADIEGYDSCRKIAILASIMTDREVNFEEVHTEGITKIDSLDFRYAAKLGASIKLVGSALREADGIAVTVFPLLIAQDNPLYSVSGVYNGILVKGNLLDTTMLYGSGAGMLPTASAVLADMLEAAKHPAENLRYGWHGKALSPKPVAESSHRYLVRFAGNAAELGAEAAERFGRAELIVLEGTEEFALLTPRMREREYRTIAAGFSNIISMIRAELD